MDQLEAMRAADAAILDSIRAADEAHSLYLEADALVSCAVGATPIRAGVNRVWRVTHRDAGRAYLDVRGWDLGTWFVVEGSR